MPQFLSNTQDAFQLQRDAAAERLAAERIRDERFGVHDVRDFAPIPLASADMWPEQCAAMRPFFDAFAEGRPLWQWVAKQFGDEPRWRPVEQLNVLQRPEWLSLEYRTDAPKLETEL
jgi:hypothetical protein